MRKLRRAALVAAMVGSLGMVGAGVASAQDAYDNGDDKKDKTVVVACEQANLSESTQGDASNYEGGGLLGLIPLNLSLLDTTANQTQQQNICAGGDVYAVQVQETSGGLLNGLLGRL
ncbi:hypothetical protein [Streptomyces sp. SYSU K217416]